MNKLLILCLLLAGLTSCSKDSFDQSPDPAARIEKSEILVTVSYLAYENGQCQQGCGGTATQVVSYLTNAHVEVYMGIPSDVDQASAPSFSGLTDLDGKAFFEQIEPGTYTIRVNTPFGEKSRTISAQEHRRAFVEFSF